MTEVEFTQKQISFLADKIINKLVLPLHVLESAIEQGKVNEKYLVEARKQLMSIVEWIRETGG